MSKKKIVGTIIAIATGATLVVTTIKDKEEPTKHIKSGVETEWSQSTEITTK